ncbi:putative quinol monooxygenase [uncultured Jatrophihabitans sp.]|uniref:putative quinol monooxygenase n=1 Tax=uncultured Jatrophihabitans sp. TaxID=1610747 RepID=UPI0035C972BC
MSELPVVAVITAKDGSADLVRDALKALVPPTRAEEGCLSYALYESASTPGVFVTVESWRDKSDLDAHMASDHIAQTFAVAGDGLAGAPVIHALTPVDV